MFVFLVLFKYWCKSSGMRDIIRHYGSRLVTENLTRASAQIMVWSAKIRYVFGFSFFPRAFTPDIIYSSVLYSAESGQY